MLSYCVEIQFYRLYNRQWNILLLMGRDYLPRIISLKVSVMLNFESTQLSFISNAHYFDHTFPKIDKISNLLEVTKIYSHSKDAYNSDEIVLCNHIKREAEIYTTNLR